MPSLVWMKVWFAQFAGTFSESQVSYLVAIVFVRFVLLVLFFVLCSNWNFETELYRGVLVKETEMSPLWCPSGPIFIGNHCGFANDASKAPQFHREITWIVGKSGNRRVPKPNWIIVVSRTTKGGCWLQCEKFSFNARSHNTNWPSSIQLDFLWCKSLLPMIVSLTLTFQSFQCLFRKKYKLCWKVIKLLRNWKKKMKEKTCKWKN